MKALTLTQPWASLMLLQQKRIETRSWPTAYRGEMIIHAAKGFPQWARDTCEEEPFRSALGNVRASDLPLSQGLCVVRILGCFPTTESGLAKLAFAAGRKPSTKELLFGDYTEGRYAWLTEFVRAIPPRVNPVNGHLGLWAWDGGSNGRQTQPQLIASLGEGNLELFGNTSPLSNKQRK